MREASSASRAVYTSVDELIAMRAAARECEPGQRQPTEHLLSARGADAPAAASADWGRPLYSTLAAMQPRAADDERPVLLVVDQRLNMFFGARRSLKSVAAAEAAALCAWQAFERGDQIGGIVFNDAAIDTVEPLAGAAGAMRLIGAVATQNAELRANSTQPRSPAMLDAALKAAAALAGKGDLIVVVSDFNGRGPRTRDLLIRLADANDVMAVLVYDPFLPELPKSGDIIVSRGELLVDFDFGGGRIRRSLFEFAEAQGRDALALERQIGVPAACVSAAEETAPQVRGLIERAGRRRL